jgi:N-methylhydantoinase B/oxoprolinase/acetone carboxylase alpha subunit
MALSGAYRQLLSIRHTDRAAKANGTVATAPLQGVRFLETMTASILSNNRIKAAVHMAGGGRGQCGRNQCRAGGRVRPVLPASTEMQPVMRS